VACADLPHIERLILIREHFLKREDLLGWKSAVEQSLMAVTDADYRDELMRWRASVERYLRSVELEIDQLLK
jgi:hypothetical protein